VHVSSSSSLWRGSGEALEQVQADGQMPETAVKNESHFLEIAGPVMSSIAQQ